MDALLSRYFKEPVGSQHRHKLCTEINKTIPSDFLFSTDSYVFCVWHARLVLECTGLQSKISNLQNLWNLSCDSVIRIQLMLSEGGVAKLRAGLYEEELLVSLLNLRDILKKEDPVKDYQTDMVNTACMEICKYPGLTRDVITAVAFVSVQISSGEHLTINSLSLIHISEPTRPY